MISIDLSKFRKKVAEPLKHIGNVPIEETKTYDLTNYDVVKQFISTNPDGIFGIEYYRDQFSSNTRLFANSQVKVNLMQTKQTLLDANREEVDCFLIKSEKPNYMPFRFDMQEDIWDLIEKYTERYFDKEQIYLQVIFHKARKWKQEMFEKYNSYLDGIESPSSNRFILDMQYKLQSLLKDNDKKPYEFREVEEKLEQTGYHISQRIMILGNEKTRKKLLDKVKIAYNHMAYANHWMFIQTKETKPFIEDMQLRIPDKQHKHILCVSELMPYFGGVAEVIVNEKLDIPRPSTLKEEQPTIIKQYKAFDDSDQQVINDIEWAFQRVKLLRPGEKLEVVEVREGTNLKFITFMRPDGMKLKNIENSLDDMELDLQINGLSVEPGTVRGSISIAVPKSERVIIQLESMMNDSEFKLFAAGSELPCIVGVDMFGKPFFADLVKMVHLLIVGTTGSGKSVFINNLIIVLTTLLSPQQLQLYLIDPKQVELTPFKDLPHVPQNGYTTDPQKSLRIYQKVIDIMEHRYETLADEGVKNIAQYNKKHPENKWDYIVVVTDEFADLIMQQEKKNVLDEVVVRLGQKARACGIHLIMATQRPEQKVVSGLLKSNLPTKISFALPSHHDYMTVYGKMIPYRLLGKGDGVFSTVAYSTPNEFNRFQSSFIDDDELPNNIATITKKWATKRKVNVTEVVIEQEPEPEGREEQIDEKYEELKRIICETGESRMNELQKKTKMNRKKLQAYMQQLVDDGWLDVPPTRSAGYRLLLSKEQMEELLTN